MSIRVVSAAPEDPVRNASELHPGDYVVYPSQGVHRVTGFERMDIAGQQLEVLKLEREHDGATVIVPVEKVPSTGLRRVAARELVEDVFHLLAAPGTHVELDWKERHREIGERLIRGGVLGIAEVVKELHDLAQIRPPPPKERERYDQARHLLVQEVAVSLAVPPGVAEDYVDYALTPPAGVELPVKPLPKPKRARWVVLRRERRPPAPESLEEEFGPGEIALEVGEPGEGSAAAGVITGAAKKKRGKKVPPRTPTRRKQAPRGERAAKARPKKRPPTKPRAKKARPAKRRIVKTGAARRRSRARR